MATRIGARCPYRMAEQVQSQQENRRKRGMMMIYRGKRIVVKSHLANDHEHSTNNDAKKMNVEKQHVGNEHIQLFGHSTLGLL
mmetsp:Transcript_5388/g.6222  ORF Transcript_5388/g.6222 Transcript_5388/m.6222 type:complete len:83 (-) Transcript_5388:110-358(-)